jgi:hypothetical protein
VSYRERGFTGLLHPRATETVGKGLIIGKDATAKLDTVVPTASPFESAVAADDRRADARQGARSNRGGVHRSCLQSETIAAKPI